MLKYWDGFFKQKHPNETDKIFEQQKFGATQ